MDRCADCLRVQKISKVLYRLYRLPHFKPQDLAKVPQKAGGIRTGAHRCIEGRAKGSLHKRYTSSEVFYEVAGSKRANAVRCSTPSRAWSCATWASSSAPRSPSAPRASARASERSRSSRTPTPSWSRRGLEREQARGGVDTKRFVPLPCSEHKNPDLIQIAS